MENKLKRINGKIFFLILTTVFVIIVVLCIFIPLTNVNELPADKSYVVYTDSLRSIFYMKDNRVYHANIRDDFIAERTPYTSVRRIDGMSTKGHVYYYYPQKIFGAEIYESAKAGIILVDKLGNVFANIVGVNRIQLLLSEVCNPLNKDSIKISKDGVYAYILTKDGTLYRYNTHEDILKWLDYDASRMYMDDVTGGIAYVSKSGVIKYDAPNEVSVIIPGIMWYDNVYLSVNNGIVTYMKDGLYNSYDVINAQELLDVIPEEVTETSEYFYTDGNTAYELASDGSRVVIMTDVRQMYADKEGWVIMTKPNRGAKHALDLYLYVRGQAKPKIIEQGITDMLIK